MKSPSHSAFPASLPRRDIVAICSYLNRHPGPKAVDGCISGGASVYLDRLAAAARMQ